jgi:hypothetical protein
VPVRILDDPIGDPAWADLLTRHPRASVFHAPGWIDALRRTYGYQPFVITTSPGPRLENGLVVCRVTGWRGPRLVSLPFSDHCDPLVDRPEDLQGMLSFLSAQVENGSCRSIELRPPESLGCETFVGCPFKLGATFTLHTLDLRPDPSEIFRRFHPSCVQRAVRRAEREGLTYEAGRSECQLERFYGLLRLTRRRHGLPPQPLAWFRTLLACLGDRVTIHLVSRGTAPLGALLTLSFRRALVYKYGASDAAEHRLGSVPFLFWRVIRDAKVRGFEEFDLGRSDLDQPGLVSFKDHFGARRSTLTYYRAPGGRSDLARASWARRITSRIFRHLPSPVLSLTGRLVYKHLG